jgi:transcriptional regulator with XRE-family HTH domain
MEFSKWLTLKFIDWQASQGVRKTISEFAKYLGVSQQTTSLWLNGNARPSGKNIGLLANKLGVEIYDVLEIPKPAMDPEVERWVKLIKADPAIMEMIKIISELPEEKAKEFTEKILKLAIEMAGGKGGKKKKTTI